MNILISIDFLLLSFVQYMLLWRGEHLLWAIGRVGTSFANWSSTSSSFELMTHFCKEMEFRI